MFLKEQFAHIAGIMLDTSGMNSRSKVRYKVIHTVVNNINKSIPILFSGVTTMEHI